MAPSKKDAKPRADKPAAKTAASGDKPTARATVMAAAPGPAGDPACPLPPKAKSHVVLLDDTAKVGDRVMCENDHLLVVTQLSPPQFVKA
ncbi:MAG: hypothetical protein ABIY55_13545 [Kofleriaceae bacterium]